VFVEELVSNAKVAAITREGLDEEKRRIGTSLVESRTATLGSKMHCSSVSPEELSRKWGVSLDKARETLKATAQRSVGKGVQPSTR
jgi:hypothetical protein